jgi:tRNA pseudouridine55 synthase
LAGCGAHIEALHRSSIGPWNDPGLARTVELHGRELLPWASSHVLTDQEVGQLRQGMPIACGEIEPPTWTLPETFPDPQAPVRGVHRERLVFLLNHQDGQLIVRDEFRGGV